MGEKNREGSSRNMCKGHMDKAKGGMFEGGRQGAVVGSKWRQLYLNNKNKKNNKN